VHKKIAKFREETDQEIAEESPFVQELNRLDGVVDYCKEMYKEMQEMEDYDQGVPERVRR
jgi:hypothetical protein